MGGSQRYQLLRSPNLQEPRHDRNRHRPLCYGCLRCCQGRCLRRLPRLRRRLPRPPHVSALDLHCAGLRHVPHRYLRTCRAPGRGSARLCLRICGHHLYLPLGRLLPVRLGPCLLAARLRAMNVALAAATQWLFNFVVARTVLTMQQTMGQAGYGMFFMFGTFDLCMFVFVWFFVPRQRVFLSRRWMSSSVPPTPRAVRASTTRRLTVLRASTRALPRSTRLLAFVFALPGSARMSSSQDFACLAGFGRNAWLWQKYLEEGMCSARGVAFPCLVLLPFLRRCCSSNLDCNAHRLHSATASCLQRVVGWWLEQEAIDEMRVQGDMPNRGVLSSLFSYYTRCCYTCF